MQKGLFGNFIVVERGSVAKSNQFMDFSLEDKEKRMAKETIERYVSPTCTDVLIPILFLDRAATPKRLFGQGLFLNME